MSPADKARHKRYTSSAKGKAARSRSNRNYAQKLSSKVLRLKRRFGVELTVAEYDEMLTKQHGVCAICLSPDSRCLAVDHDHATGEVRGLLCRQCNLGLGYFADNPDSLLSAVKYLSF